MIQSFIAWIAPKNFDPQMLWVTEFYLNSLILIFLGFFLWIIGRIFFRWIGLVIARNKVTKQQKNPEDFVHIRNYLKENLFKKRSWAKNGFLSFCRAWEESRPRNKDKAIMPIRLREFLPPEIVLDGIRNRRLAEALPGIFVALGIFGTFLGLVLGLQGLKFGELDSLQRGVGHLISGLSLAFLTSLAGIALSITFSFLYRMVVSRLEYSFLALDESLIRFFPYDSQERYARRHYEIQEGIKQGLQTLSTDIATKITGTIGSKLGDAFDEHFLPVMQDFHVWVQAYMEENMNQQKKLSVEFNQDLAKLSKIITKNFENSQDKQTEAMGEVLKQYSETLTGTFRNQFEAMGKIIEETTRSQHEIKQQLIEFSETLKNQLQSQGEMIEKTNRAGEILGQSLDSLETIAQNLKASSDDITSAAKLLERSASSAKEGQETLYNTMINQIEAMTRTREELDRSWLRITEDSDYLVTQIRQVVQELTKGVSENLIQALDSFDMKVAEVVDRFSGTLFEATETMAEMPGVVMSLNKSLESINNGISDQKEILNDIRETSRGMVAENIQKAFKASKDLGSCTESIASTASALNRFIESFNEKITVTAESFAGRNQKSIEILSNIVNKLTEELKNSRISMEENSSVIQSLDLLNKTPAPNSDVNQLAEQIAILTKHLRTMATNISKLNENRSGEVELEILKRIAAIDKHVAGLSTGMVNQILPRADNLRVTIESMSASLEALKIEFQKDPEKTKGGWIFGRSAKR